MSTNIDIATEYIEYLWNQGRTDLADKYVAADSHSAQRQPGGWPVSADHVHRGRPVSRCRT